MDTQTALDPNALSQAQHYVSKIKSSGYRPTKVVVFGSTAKGTRHAFSDIDLCIVSPQFTDENLFDDGVKLSILTDESSQDVEPHPMTLEDYNSKWYPLAHEIRTHGIEIKI